MYVWPLYVWALYVWPLYVSTLCVSTLCVTTLCEHSMCDHYVSTLKLDFNEKYHEKPTSGRMLQNTEKYEKYHDRMLQNTEKYENYHEKSTSVLVPDVAEHGKVRKVPRKTDFSSWAPDAAAPKTSKKHEFYCKKPVQEEKYENYHEKWTSKKLTSRKLWKFTDKTPARRPRPPGNYENSHTKRTCKHETTKIAMNSVRRPSATSI